MKVCVVLHGGKQPETPFKVVAQEMRLGWNLSAADIALLRRQSTCSEERYLAMLIFCRKTTNQMPSSISVTLPAGIGNGCQR